MIVISSGGRWNISPVSGDFDGKFGAMGIKTYPAAANFILLKSEHDLADIAMESGIACAGARISAGWTAVFQDGGKVT